MQIVFFCIQDSNLFPEVIHPVNTAHRVEQTVHDHLHVEILTSLKTSDVHSHLES